MKKIGRIENLDCAHCAAKLERAIQKIDGVNAASISFMTQRLTVEADDARFGEVAEQIKKTVKKTEPNCKLSGF